MKPLRRNRGGRGVGWGLMLGLGVVACGAGNDPHGMEPVYPELHPDRTRVVGAEEMASVLAELPGWAVEDGVLFKVFQTGSFRDAVAMIVRISYDFDRLDHHPEIRNIYGKVYLGFTTYDQGKKVTALDVEAARAVERALGSDGAEAATGH